MQQQADDLLLYDIFEVFRAGAVDYLDFIQIMLRPKCELGPSGYQLSK